MTTTTLNIYTALVEAGIEDSKAVKIAEAVVSKEQAEDFATKSDLKDLKVDLYKAMGAQTIVIVGLIGALLTRM